MLIDSDRVLQGTMCLLPWSGRPYLIVSLTLQLVMLLCVMFFFFHWQGIVISELHLLALRLFMVTIGHLLLFLMGSLLTICSLVLRMCILNIPMFVVMDLRCVVSRIPILLLVFRRGDEMKRNETLKHFVLLNVRWGMFEMAPPVWMVRGLLLVRGLSRLMLRVMQVLRLECRRGMVLLEIRIIRGIIARRRGFVRLIVM